MDPKRAEPGSPLTPVLESERIDSLDVLRGVALLGIFVMNIPTFALSYYAFFNPPLQGGFEGGDYWAWLIGHLFFDQKMMPIFSVLFGAGIVLFAERLQRRGGSGVASVHYRRMAWLLVIGVLHAYLIWYGDILVAYSLVGMLLFPLRRLSPRTLLLIAALLFPVAPILGVLQQLAFEGMGGMSSEFYPDQRTLDAERAAMLGSFADRAIYSAPDALMMQTWIFFTWGLWRVSSMMLLGMALYKWGVLSARRSARFYSTMLFVGLFAGMPLVLLGVWRMQATDFDAFKILGVNGAFNYFGSLGIALAWIGLVMVLCRVGALPRLQAALAAVGRMAFTNYLSQSLIAAFIFFGWGLGYYGSMSRSELLLVVAGTWLFQIGFSLVWLRFFRFGPMEWLWRVLTYQKLAPLLRTEAGPINPEGDTDR